MDCEAKSKTQSSESSQSNVTKLICRKSCLITKSKYICVYIWYSLSMLHAVSWAVQVKCERENEIFMMICSVRFQWDEFHLDTGPLQRQVSITVNLVCTVPRHRARSHNQKSQQTTLKSQKISSFIFLLLICICSNKFKTVTDNNNCWREYSILMYTRRFI